MAKLPSIQITALALTAALATTAAFAQPPCPTRQDVVNLTQNGYTPQQIKAMYPGCPWPVPTPWTPLPSQVEWDDTYPVPGPPMKWINNNGNVEWEGLDSCGYHPQDKRFACVLEIRKRTGYFGFPEWVKFCVDFGNGMGFQPVTLGSVDVSEEPFGQQPIWYFSVTGDVPANSKLDLLPLNRKTLVARAALSWLIPPLDCNTPFFWGNTATFRIRLDP